MRLLGLVLVAMLAVGCERDGIPLPDPPQPDPNFYCAPAVLEPAPTIVERVSSSLAAIVGGEPSVDRRATVFVRIGSSGYCTGTVINKRTVVTAAHCIGGSTHAIEIREGGGIESWNVIEAKGHPDYDTDPIQWYRGDIAVMIVDRDLPPPYAPLYAGASQSKDCETLVCQGHGTDLDGSTPVGLLQEVPCRVEQQFEFLLMTDGRAPNSGICFGDSGGPMYALVGGVPHLAGVTSWTRDRDCTRGSGHISAWYYRDWLAANAYQED